MTCVPAPACRAALGQATALFPGRSKLSDGVCASAQHHQDNPNSDHETGDAWDLTHDPASGCDVDTMFAIIVEHRDPRVKYLIRNRRILRSYDKPGIPAWTWASYTGSNPHDKHGHCSILPGARNDVSAWFKPIAPVPTPTPLEDDDMPAIYVPSDDQYQPLPNRAAILRVGNEYTELVNEAERDQWLKCGAAGPYPAPPGTLALVNHLATFKPR